jgi:micrococcal nuclease
MHLRLATLAFCLSTLSSAADNIAPSAAKDHIGQTATVCGKVVGTRYLDQSPSKITFLNFEKPFPDTPFTAVIQGENRAKFGEPETLYLNKNLCVTGKIEEYNQKPQMVLTNPNQVKVETK